MIENNQIKSKKSRKPKQFKQCSKCDEIKHINEFYPNRGDCKTCHGSHVKAKYSPRKPKKISDQNIKLDDVNDVEKLKLIILNLQDQIYHYKILTENNPNNQSNI